MGCWLEKIFLWTTLCENGYVFHGYCSFLFLFFSWGFFYIRVGCVSLSIMKVLFPSDPAPNKTFVSNFPSPHLGWHLIKRETIKMGMGKNEDLYRNVKCPYLREFEGSKFLLSLEDLFKDLLFELICIFMPDGAW